MGRQYALLNGEPPEVAEALFTHYLPRHADDELPQDKVGALVGLADRLDTICGCFGVGLSPTGAADPYGLRRHALAVIRILRSTKLHLDLASAVAAALELLKDKISRTGEETALEVLDFFQTRLQHLLLVEGFDHETITAVLAAGCRDVVDAADKVRALHEFRQSPEFPSLAMAFKRVINIAQGAEPGEVDPAIFQYGEENILYQSTKLMESQVTQALESRDYPGVCRALAGLRGPVDAYFEKVMVMSEDADLRRNRLALLLRISQTFLLMADFSKNYDVLAMRRWFRRKGKDTDQDEENGTTPLVEETEPGPEAAAAEVESRGRSVGRVRAGGSGSSPPQTETDSEPQRRGFLRRWRREAEPSDAAPPALEEGAAESGGCWRRAAPRRPFRYPPTPGAGNGAGHPHRPRNRVRPRRPPEAPGGGGTSGNLGG